MPTYSTPAALLRGDSHPVVCAASVDDRGVATVTDRRGAFAPTRDHTLGLARPRGDQRDHDRLARALVAAGWRLAAASMPRPVTHVLTDVGLTFDTGSCTVSMRRVGPDHIVALEHVVVSAGDALLDPCDVVGDLALPCDMCAEVADAARDALTRAGWRVRENPATR